MWLIYLIFTMLTYPDLGPSKYCRELNTQTLSESKVIEICEVERGNEYRVSVLNQRGETFKLRIYDCLEESTSADSLEHSCSLSVNNWHNAIIKTQIYLDKMRYHSIEGIRFEGLNVWRLAKT
jgi:hypothetical protein